MKHPSKKALIGVGLATLLLGYLTNRFVGCFLSLKNAGGISDQIDALFQQGFRVILENPVTVAPQRPALLAGGLVMIAIVLGYCYHLATPKNYRKGEEHGSARWGCVRDITPFLDPNPEQNLILTASEGLSLSPRMSVTAFEDYNRNKNVLVIGGAGSGKSRYFVKPNLMQLHSSYGVTDSKGALLRETGDMLRKKGYQIKVLNLIHMDESDTYNPFTYLSTEKDVLKLVRNLIKNTTPPQSKSEDDFWVKAETAFLTALFSYMVFELPEEDRTISTVLDMLHHAEAREDVEGYVSDLDALFLDLAERKPHSFAAAQYDIYKKAAGKTAKSILISVGVRLSPFMISDVQKLLSKDTMFLDEIATQKTALFVILSDTDSTFNFLASILYQQLFDILVQQADAAANGMLPIPIRFLLDEFANIGQIPEFDRLIATIRSRNISANIILQNLAQIKNLYPKTWETITANADSLLFLGGMEQSTLEYVSKIIGEETVDHKSRSIGKGERGSLSEQEQIIRRRLLTPDEVGTISGKQCILKIRGVVPFLSKKYDITQHKNYSLLAGESKGNGTIYHHDGEKRITLQDIEQAIRTGRICISEDLQL